MQANTQPRDPSDPILTCQTPSYPVHDVKIGYTTSAQGNVLSMLDPSDLGRCERILLIDIAEDVGGIGRREGWSSFVDIWL